MMAKPMKTLQLHYPMIQFLIIQIITYQETVTTGWELFVFKMMSKQAITTFTM